MRKGHLRWIMIAVTVGVLILAFMIYPPFSYRGRVVDQFGQAVPDAEVMVSLNNRLLRPGTRKVLKTDGNGEFSIKGFGISLYVEASKPGYYRVPPREGRPGSFGGDGKDVGASGPGLYTLHKQGVLEPLQMTKEIRVKVSPSGEPSELVLGDGKSGRMVLVQCWNDEAESETDGRYNWRFRVSVPEGGLQRRGDALDFEAPVEGYKEWDEHSFSKDMPEGLWDDSVEQSYFVRYNDGIFARVDLRMIAHGGHYVVFSGCLNPKAGSRNLEANPAE